MKPATQAEIDRALYGRRRQKYGNKRHNGYASKKEANRAAELQMLEAAKLIGTLQYQVRFELLPADGKNREVCYVADFTYFEFDADKSLWVYVVEDVKGFRTPVYKLKRRMMWHLRGVRIRET